MNELKEAISYSKLRRALARQAYYADHVRLVDTDISGADCLVASRHGVFAVSQSGARVILHGLFFGITIDRGHVYLFEACDDTRKSNWMGRVIRLRRDGDRLCEPEVLCKGLDNGCHQIALIDDELIVVDTYRQLLQRFTREGAHIATFDPIPPYTSEGRYAPTQVHMNSIRQVCDSVLLMLHNGNTVPSAPSEVLVVDRQWAVVDRYKIDGYGCHDIVALEDGTLLFCGSEDGELIGSNGLKIKVSEDMTRGLAFNATTVMIGTSRFAQREARDMVDGSVIYLDRSYRRLCEVPLHGAPTCIVSL